MNNEHLSSGNGTDSRTAPGIAGFLTNIKYLLKGKVLVANVLPVFTAFWLALHFSGESFTGHLGTFLLTMIGSTLTIAGALMFNNWYEADLDRKMARTQNRPTVTGAFTLRSVLYSAVITTVLGLAVMLLTTIEAALYSFLGWFFYVVLYTFWSKRKYTVNTIIGSISGAFTPLIGWAAVAPAAHIVPIMLFYLLFIWQIPHTLAIAIRRLSDYTRAGIPMLPVVSGIPMTIRQMVIYVIALLPFPFLLLPSMGMIFFIISLALTIGWIILVFRGLKSSDTKKWAVANLRYSLVYLIIIMLVMIIVTI